MAPVIGAEAISGFTIPSAEQLISIDDINDIDGKWIDSEIAFLNNFSVENAIDPTYKNATKPVLQQKLTEVANRTSQLTNLVCILHRLAKANSNSKKLCEGVVNSISEKLERAEILPHNSYANVLKIPGQGAKPKSDPAKQMPTATPKELSPIAPVFTPNPRHEITIVPENYENEMKSLQKTLSNSQVSGSRKSRNGNIVLSFPSNQSLQNAQSTLSKNDKIKLHTHEKTLPKMTIRNVDLPDDEIKNSILMKNPKVRSLVETGHFFDVLFVQKISLKNNNSSTSESRNAIIKVDPAIRNIIKENKFKIFVGFRNCTVFDRIHFKTCYNCQKIGSHTSAECSSNTPICRYCSQSHRSESCVHKNDQNMHKCNNCLISDNDVYKSKAKTHIANAKQCPLVEEITNLIMSNTLYEVVPKKTSFGPLSF